MFLQHIICVYDFHSPLAIKTFHDMKGFGHVHKYLRYNRAMDDALAQFIALLFDKEGGDLEDIEVSSTLNPNPIGTVRLIPNIFT